MRSAEPCTSALHEVPGRNDHRRNREIPFEESIAPRDRLQLTRGGLLATWLGQDEAMVNSLHGQGIDRIAPVLAVEAVAEDGTIEAVRVREASAFAVGVQWHVEIGALEHPLNRAILDAFGNAVRRRRDGPGVPPPSKRRRTDVARTVTRAEAERSTREAALPEPQRRSMLQRGEIAARSGERDERSKQILVERDGYVARVIINRPERRNAFSFHFLRGVAKPRRNLRQPLRRSGGPGRRADRGRGSRLLRRQRHLRIRRETLHPRTGGGVRCGDRACLRGHSGYRETPHCPGARLRGRRRVRADAVVRPPDRGPPARALR